MILERGNMWDVFGKTDLFLITTNPIRRKDGAVVMGRGIALEAKTKYPQMPYDFGKQLDIWEAHEVLKHYVGIIGKYDGQTVGFFMTKNHWRESSVLEVIERSTNKLMKVASATSKRIDLNFPGIGNGKLDREDVIWIISDLPDNVHVWEYGE